MSRGRGRKGEGEVRRGEGERGRGEEEVGRGRRREEEEVHSHGFITDTKEDGVGLKIAYK